MKETIKERHMRVRNTKYQKGGLETREELSLYPSYFETLLPKIKSMLERRDYFSLSEIPNFANYVLAAYLKYFPNMDADKAEVEMDNVCEKIMEEIK